MLIGLVLGVVFLVGITAMIVILISQSKKKNNDDGFR